MASTDAHLRFLLVHASEQRSHALVDDAFAVIEDNFDRFTEDLSPELLVVFAEVASSLREREQAVVRALDLFDSLRCEDDQFRIRALLARCIYEARLGSEECQLKGLNLLQHLQYALKFITQALAIATKPGNDTRYGFLIQNASLVFWDVVRPMCRAGWQRYIVDEAITMLEAIKVVAKAGNPPPATGKGASKGPVSPTPTIPVQVSPVWLAELALHVAFGLEDAGKPDGEAQKRVEEASQLMEEHFKQDAALEARHPSLRAAVLSARAYFSRKQPGKMREDIDKASATTTLGTTLFVRNGGIPQESSEEEMIKAWSTIDKEFDIRAARDTFDSKAPLPAKSNKVNLKPAQLVELATMARAACMVERWALALPMLVRLEVLSVPPGHARLLFDLCKAESEVWKACKFKHEDPVTKMLLLQNERKKVEIEARHRAVRLCEQCVQTAKRLGKIELIEDSAVTMWSLGRELACNEHRHRIHQSLQKCAEILEEILPPRLVQLRVQLYFEIAQCEMGQDFLTKGQAAFERAKALDYTVPDTELSEVAQKQVVGTDCDPAPYIRRFDAVISDRLQLLHWKLNIYEEPTDPVDQVMLLLDQPKKQTCSKNGTVLASNLLVQGFSKLQGVLAELQGDRLQEFSDTFVPPARVMVSGAALKCAPDQAPAIVKEGGPVTSEITLPGQVAAIAIRDQRPQSDREKAVARVKRIVMLMCKIGLEAHRAGQADLAIDVFNCAFAAAKDVPFGPPPKEVEGALLLAEAAYAKAHCLSKQLEDYDVINGINDELPEEEDESADAHHVLEDIGNDSEEVLGLTEEEKVVTCGKKRELIQALFLGVDKSYEFKQWWMIANGMVHWWNLHLDLVKFSVEEPSLLRRVLDEYREGLKKLQSYLSGSTALPSEEFDPALALNLALVCVNASAAVGNLSAMEVDQLTILKRLGANERKVLAARVCEVCKEKGKPFPDFAKLRPERLETKPPDKTEPKKKEKDKNIPPPSSSDDKSDLQGNEVEVMAAVKSMPYAKDGAEAQKLAEQAVALLNRWEPAQNDESMLTLHAELWTHLGRQCLKKPMNPSGGAKYALMCGIKALAQLDAPVPKYASKDRLCWRGACHTMCGDALVQLIDPHKQEKEAIMKLRSMAVAQYEICGEYAMAASSRALATAGATNLWNVALPLLHSSETRQVLISPLLRTCRALAAVRYREDPYFFVGLYVALFDCYSDRRQWENIHEMLNEAFAAIPSSCHRRLWSLRMLALSRQGKNVSVAIGQMKESQAKPQAAIWLTLADVSSKQADQLGAYIKAVDILHGAQQPDVAEVRMQFADWLIRNGFAVEDAKEQLDAAADMLLEIEEAVDDMDEADADSDEECGSDTSDDNHRSEMGSKSDRMTTLTMRSRRSLNTKARSIRSHVTSRSKGSHTSIGRKSLGGKSARSNRSKISASSKRSSKSSKAKKAEEDVEVPGQLYAHHYDALCRVFSMRSQLSSGSDVHAAFTAAVHFAIRFFAGSLELANSFAQELSALAALAGVDGRGSSSAERRTRGAAGANSKILKNLPTWLPCFAVPTNPVDWALVEELPWRRTDHYSQIMSKAEQAGMTSQAPMTWVGHPEAFAQPPLSFHMLVRLEDDLEVHGLHALLFPIFALHLELAQAFSEPVRTSVLCLVQMRMSRVAAECRLAEPAAAARTKWMESLPLIPNTFGSFEEELDQIRRHRGGCGSSGADPEWLEVQGAAARGVSAAWSCSQLYAYEVWAELSKECALHGELFMACILAEQATKHAKIHGDGRTLRSLCITKARLANEEGQPLEVVRLLKDVKAADGQQTVQVALLLAEAYSVMEQHYLADEALAEAGKMLAKRGRESSSPESLHALAVATIKDAQLHLELAHLASPAAVAHSWLSTLDAAFRTFETTAAELDRFALPMHRVKNTATFARVVVALLEGKMRDLSRDPSGWGDICLEDLVPRTNQLCEVLSEARTAKAALLAGAMLLEGFGESAGIVLPADVLVARLDVWEVRAIALRRELAKVVKDSLDRKTDRPAEICAEPTRQVQYSTAKGATREVVDAWLTDVDTQIAEKAKVNSVARELSEVEMSMVLVTNALAILQPPCSPEVPSLKADELGHLTWKAEAMVELGRLQLEHALASGTRKPLWEEAGLESTEDKAEAEPPDAAVNTAENGTAPGNPKTAVEQEAEQDGKELERELENSAKATLSEGLKAALRLRDFSAAIRASKALALQAYGSGSARTAFQNLVYLQSVDVCIKAQAAFGQLMSKDHKEQVQMRLLQRLEQQWPYPNALEAYRATLNRLHVESPIFQRFQLNKLPEVPELLLAYLPPLTLVATLQLHGSHLYLAAALTPPPGEKAQRLEQLSYVAKRVTVSEATVLALVRKFQEINVAVEKELVEKPELNAPLIEQSGAVLAELEEALAKPVARELKVQFWPSITDMEEPPPMPTSSNKAPAPDPTVTRPAPPQRLVMLPDDSLWDIPLEHLQPLLDLFGSKSIGALSRDLSLHLAAQRVWKSVEDPNGGEPKPLKAQMGLLRPAGAVLLTDPFGEDVLHHTEPVKSETMCKVHARLVDMKLVGNGARSLHGQTYQASPKDVTMMLCDANTFYALGFGKLFTVMPASSFASLDLRHLGLLGLFLRSMNDRAFRRQTKVDSTKSTSQLALENPYTTSLVAGFRGVQCQVMAIGPVPSVLNTKCFDAFVKALQSTKIVSKAFEEMLTQHVESAEQRYARPQESEDPRKEEGKKEKNSKKQDAGKADGKEVEVGRLDMEDLLPPHTRGSYVMIGAAWASSEDPPAEKEKPTKKK